MADELTFPPDIFRIYSETACGDDGYPVRWHRGLEDLYPDVQTKDGNVGVKHVVRHLAGNRCVRCLHPYPFGSSAEWSVCSEDCKHTLNASSKDGSPTARITHPDGRVGMLDNSFLPGQAMHILDGVVEARWRILTVHHLQVGAEYKRDLRWWNLTPLCQRCHLQIQGKVVMARVWPWPHSDWFKPYAAGWYAWCYEGRYVSWEEAHERMDELLAYELTT